MKLDQDTTAGLMVLTFFIVGLSIVGAGAIWDNQQVRMMYSNAYAKNQECRMSSQKSGFTNSIERICGPIPKWEDYQK